MKRPPRTQDVTAFAMKFIIEKIDTEGKFIRDAVYELTGEQLFEYLAFAYEAGKKVQR